MKKLLFIGALLIAGATSFGAVSDPLTSASTSGNTGTDLKGEATLRLTSKGTVLDPTGKAILVVTPTVNTGADGESLSFDFADMIVGQTQSLVGKFTAQVVTSDNSGGVTELPFGNATVTTTLGKINDSDEGTLNGNTLSQLDLIDTVSSAVIGDLTYQISTVKTNPTTYTGEVTATAVPSGVGSFLNKAAKITVSVAGFSYTGD